MCGFFRQITLKIHKFFLCLFVLWILGTVIFIFVVETWIPEKLLRKTDAIVVFTGAKGRIEKALSLYSKGYAKYLHVSGNFLHAEYGSISYDAAKNTKENILMTQKWIKKNHVQSVYLVTSSYHMPRSYLFAQKKWPCTVYPYPLHQSSEEPNTIIFFRLFKEYNKFLCFFLIWAFL